MLICEFRITEIFIIGISNIGETCSPIFKLSIGQFTKVIMDFEKSLT
jgi:hypothetical protein